MFNLLDLICITFLILFYKTAFWAMRVRNDIESNEYHKNQKKYIEQVMFKPHYLYFQHKNYVSPLNFYGNLITFIFAVLFFINGIIYLYVCNSKIGEIIYSDSEAIGYDITLNASPDEEGNSHYEYIKTTTN